MSLFDVDAGHIERLNPEQLVRLLKQLLYLEAGRHGIPTSAASVPLRSAFPMGARWSYSVERRARPH